MHSDWNPVPAKSFRQFARSFHNELSAANRYSPSGDETTVQAADEETRFSVWVGLHALLLLGNIKRAVKSLMILLRLSGMIQRSIHEAAATKID